MDFVMRTNLVRPPLFAAALLCLVVGRAQAGSTPTAAPRPSRPAPPPATADAGDSDSLPSTVSPAIAKLAGRLGQDIPSPPPPATALPPVVPPLVDVGAGGLPRPLPPAAADVGTAGREPRPDPLFPATQLKTAPTMAGECRLPINLATALRLADARPLVVAAAQAGVWVAEAELTRAKVLWVPTLNFGFDYIRHDGGGPDFNKGILTAPSVNFFYGGGALALIFPLTDAIFQPLVARRDLNARHWEAQAAKNDTLLQVADAYFQVHQARGNYTGALFAVERGHDLVGRIETMTGDLVTRVELERARNLLADLEQRAAQARQDWRVRSADLTQVLRLDPRTVVEPLEHDHAQVTLIDPARPLDDLMPVALNNRPELAARRERVASAEYAVRREKARPLTPTVYLNGFQTSYENLQAGIFGIGPNSSLNQWKGRVDISPQLLWQLEGLGFGNLARIKAQRGQQSRAVIDLNRMIDAVAGDVTRAQARLQSATVRVRQAERALRTGITTFNGHLEGLGQTRRFGDVLVLTYRPQEAVYSLQLMQIAFNEYFTTVADYNRAQFELFHALGYPAQELTMLRTPGDVRDVPTGRPAYLPPVGNGPPPATR